MNVIFIPLFVAYGVMAWVEWELDPSEWSTPSRVVCVFIGVILMVILATRRWMLV